jgi:transposase
MWQNRTRVDPDATPDQSRRGARADPSAARKLAAAAARASGAEALIAHMKLVIAKLRREQYGQSSERGRKVLDQLGLQLEELETETSENAVAAEDKAAGVAVQSFARQRPARAPLPAHLPRERVIIPAPCACPVAAANWPSSARTSPRHWKSSRANGR